MSTSYKDAIDSGNAWLGAVDATTVEEQVFQGLPQDVAAAVTAILQSVVQESGSTEVSMAITPDVDLTTNPNATLASVLASADISSSSDEVAVAMINGPTDAAAAAANVSAWTLTTNMAPPTQALLMGQNTAAQITFAENSPTTTMTVGGLGNSDVRFTIEKNVTVNLQGGHNDVVVTGKGDDFIQYQGGKNVTLDTGHGDDTVRLGGGNADDSVRIVSGSGNATFQLQADAKVAATINAGGGFDRLTTTGHVSEHRFDVINGKFVMHSDAPMTMENVQVVTFTETLGELTPVDQITILATTEADSLVGKLYRIAYGRSALDGQDGIWAEGMEADSYQAILNGINYWMDKWGAIEGNDINNTQHLVYSFLNSAEFKTLYDDMEDAQYVNKLFTNLNNIAQENDMNAANTINNYTEQQYVDMLASGEMNRFDVAWHIAASNEAIEVLGTDGAKYVIDANDLDFTIG